MNSSNKTVTQWKSRWATAFAVTGLACFGMGCDNGLFNFTRDSFFGSKQEKDECPVVTVSSMSTVAGTQHIEVMGVGIVANLNGTGGSPGEGNPRSMAIKELRTRGEKDPTGALASRELAVVMVRAKIQPGIMKRDLVDVEIECLSEDKQTTSLRGGELIFCKLHSYSDANKIANQVFDDGASRSGEKYLSGKPLVGAKGRVVLSASSSQNADYRKARIPSGGIALEEITFMLQLNKEHTTTADNMFGVKALGENKMAGAANAKLIADRIDERFRSGNARFSKVANAKSNEIITLRIPADYRLNPDRFLSVVSEIPVMLRPESRAEWKRMLGSQLNDPAKTQKAALRLEALGVEGCDALEAGLNNASSFVRYCSAEALIYQGKSSGLNVLLDCMRDEPACRAHALIALASSDKADCQAKLYELLGSDSVETRCGAFLALLKVGNLGSPETEQNAFQSMDRKANLLRGSVLENGVTLFQVAGNSKPLVHVSTAGTPSLVLFGRKPALNGPTKLMVGKDFIITAKEGEPTCTVSLVAEKGTVRETCDNSLAVVCTMLSRMGADYVDLVEFIRMAERSENLNCALAVDAVPNIQAISLESFSSSAKSPQSSNIVPVSKR